MLSQEELKRYHRHLIIEDFGKAEQEKLKKAKVLLIGVGGLGSAISLYLNAAGIGSLGLIDNDIVSESNLQRQILYSTQDLDKPKTDIAKQKLLDQNPFSKIITHQVRLKNDNAEAIISDYDIIVDGTDNFETRYIIDAISKKLKKPYVYGSIEEFSGQLSVFNYNNGPSYSDLFPKNDTTGNTSNREIGVIGIIPGIIGSLQANEVIKIITCKGEVLSGKLLIFDALNTKFNFFKLSRTNS